jgi:hypothetical protein
LGWSGDKEATSGGLLPQAIQPGAWVEVFGSYDKHRHALVANIVLIRDDWDRKLAGFGVIDRVITATPQPLFEADGYRIRITSATQTVFQGKLKSLDDVDTNVWVRYEGKRGKDGALAASKVEFIPAKPSRFKAVKGLEETSWDFVPPRSALEGNSGSGGASKPPFDVSDQHAVLTQDGSVRFWAIGHSYRIPADQELQSRVRRVGIRLIPAYQKALPLSDPSKIQLRFYAFDGPKIHTEICSFEGLVLIPLQLVDRLKSDDELAAVLADGVAYNLQRQGARLVEDNRAELGTEAAGDIIGAFIPGVGIATAIGSASAAQKIKSEMSEERERLALSLMANAGYNPWAAPEAWRLAAAKKLPADPGSLKYPDRSGYQLGILSSQYSNASAGENAQATALGGNAAADRP